MLSDDFQDFFSQDGNEIGLAVDEAALVREQDL